MRVGRIESGEGVFVARLSGDAAVPISVDTGGRDVLRALLEDGADIARAPALAAPIPLADCRVLAPLREPQKVLAIGLNYADHAREAGIEPPPAPILFVKTSNSIIGPGEAITWNRADSSEVDFEAELAVVIGRRARGVTEADALDHVFGYTCCNDVSARDAQFADGQWIRGKSFDTFCPLGPWIVTADEVADPQALAISCVVNGVALQKSSTSEMIFGVATLISYLSRVMTLEPGDVIATGTPFGVGFARTPPIYLAHGDWVDVSIEGVGTLTNPVIVT